MKKITFFVSSYNVEQYIEKCLESFIKIQNRNKIEVIIINDGSKDNTSSIAHKYEQLIPDLFSVVDKENGGLGSTFNVAVENAKGEYIISVDADDWIDSNEVDNFLDKIVNIYSDVITFGMINYINDNPKEKCIQRCQSLVIPYNSMLGNIMDIWLGNHKRLVP